MFVAETRRLLGESIVRGAVSSYRPRPERDARGGELCPGPDAQGLRGCQAKAILRTCSSTRRTDSLCLAETHYGLGKTVAFLSDVTNRWAADWLSWPGYGQMWAQVVRASMRRDAGEQLGWRVSREGGRR